VLSLKVASNRRATPTSRVLRLAIDRHPFTYRAGQAAWLRVDAERERAPYSIASSPEETSGRGWLEFLVKTDNSNRFGAHVDELRRGSTVLVHGPIGTFVFPDAPVERRFLFIAGGTGIAPLRSMLRHAIDAQVPGRKTLLYSARTPDEFAYLSELRALAGQGAIDLRLTLTGIADRWRHSRGRAGTELLAPLVDDETLCFLCGPPSMITEVPEILRSLGVAQKRIRTEEY
jgi:NAD(P)H-flavin reductase